MPDDRAFDDVGLADARKSEVVVEVGGGPDRALFKAAMGQGGRLAEVGLCAVAVLDDRADIRQQGRLVVFDGEDVLGVVFKEVVGELALVAGAQPGRFRRCKIGPERQGIRRI